MVFHPPHGDDCPVCREQAWAALTPEQRRQQRRYGLQALLLAAIFLAIVFGFLAWATPPVQAQSVEGVSEEAIVDEAGTPPEDVAGIVSEAPVAVAAPLTVPELITDAAQRWGLPANRLLCIAFRESTYRPWVTSPGGHRGLWQWSDQTWAWASRDAGWAGSSPYDPVTATEVAAWLMSRGGWSHWSTARYC